MSDFDSTVQKQRVHNTQEITKTCDQKKLVDEKKIQKKFKQYQIVRTNWAEKKQRKKMRKSCILNELR